MGLDLLAVNGALLVALALLIQTDVVGKANTTRLSPSE
jgi:hypothetical protein